MEMDTEVDQVSTRLDHTLNKLQERVKEQETLLEKLRNSTTPIEAQPSSDSAAYLQQLRALKIAYESLTPKDQYFPSESSPVPALLALRATDTCIDETQACIKATETSLTQAQKRLEKEQADLRDAKLIQNGLKERIASLKDEAEASTQKTSAQVAKDMIREVKQKKEHYDAEIGKLVPSFNKFIDNHLAPMLAAEELGGPIVGQDLDIDEESLGAGFDKKGKSKRTKKAVSDDKHQQRIDQIWGPRPEDAEEEEVWDEKIAAAADMRSLTQQLMNDLVGASRGGSGPYMDLPKESAASRFLIRSKVAQFHPKDSTKIRLINFGGVFDDY